MVIVFVDFSDVDIMDIYSFSVDMLGIQGEVINNGDGIFIYLVNGVFDGLVVGEIMIDIFIYMVIDDSGVFNDSVIEIVIIIIMGINDVLILVEGSIIVNEDGGVVNFDLFGIGDDVDSDDDGFIFKYIIIG